MVWNKILFLIIIINIINSKEVELQHEYTIQSEGKQFLVTLYLKQKIQINLNEIEGISSSYYYKELTLESLCNYNKIFKQYDTLEDAYSCIQKLFEKGKIKVYNTNNNLSLVFIMNSASCDNEEVIIRLEEKTISKEEINENVRLETNSLRKELNILKEENKKMKQILNEYDLRLNYLELRDENIDTKIINKKSELDFIKNEFEEKYLKINIKFNLLYRASRDGEHYNNMYTKIGNNNYHNLLLLFQTIKGVKFGAFLYKGLNKYYYNSNNYQIIIL